MGDKTVFISYSHDSDEHRERVLALSERLRQDGIKTILDQYVNGSPPGGWPRWMLDQLDAADSVLVICTETYYRRFRGHEKPGIGKGVDWEGALITQEIYNERSQTLKFVPVFLSDPVHDWIPESLRSATHYALTAEEGYRGLYDFLLGQAGVEPGTVGQLKPRPRRKGTALAFDEPPTSGTTKVDISRVIEYAPEELIGREAEMKLLNDAWTKVVAGERGRPHILMFVALGGEGKTALVAKWAAELAGQDWPSCEAAFAWSFYSQGTREQVAASSDLFLTEALTFFGNDADKEFAAGPAAAFEKGQRLARIVGQRRCLLILDGLEPLQYAPTSPTPGDLKDQGIAALLKGLAGASQSLCVVTTRYSIPNLKAFWKTAAPEVKLLRLSRAAGVHLLQTLGVKGSLLRNIASNDGKEQVNEFEKLVEDVKGHALTLTLLGAFLKRAYNGDIRQRDRVKFEKADEKIDGGHAFRTMAAYEHWLLRDGGDEGQREVAVLRLMGLFDRPADAACLAALRSEPVPGLSEPLAGLAVDDWEFCLSGLEAAKLLTVNRDARGALVSLDAHPHLREYFAKQVREMAPDAWRAAHRRLYDHLCATTKEGDHPTLEDLQPLYQAVSHGCHAGSHQEVLFGTYIPRIRRGTENYACTHLGAFGAELGAVACFFELPWSKPSANLSTSDQGVLLHNAAFRLQALSRLTEALEPTRVSGEIDITAKEWRGAAMSSKNLSELTLILGNVASAVQDAEKSVTYADRCDDTFIQVVSRTTHADALHHAARRDEAENRFREAEKIQADRQPDYPTLYSIQGFRYCNLLLFTPERAAWRFFLEREVMPSAIFGVSPKATAARDQPASTRSPNNDHAPLLERSLTVSKRATLALNWAKEGGRGWLLTIALDHLTLGHIAIYRAVLEKSESRFLSPDLAHVHAAVDGLRRAGTQDHLPRGLLARTWLRFLTGTHIGPDSAQADLDEAWEIAERGPMPLFLADIHMYRARLFFRVSPYPWAQDPNNPDGPPRGPKDDLAAARKLIEKHGYWRRKEELEDAEEAAKNW